MTYPYVQSYTDLGRARGPRLAMVWHMAEGGGTVAYLAKANPNGVSVHFVIERDGDIVQMLPLDHMHSSLRTSAIRVTDDAPYNWRGVPITYGRTAALDCLGAWADVRATSGPNHATIAVEVEGFAASGPLSVQVAAIGRLAAYVGIPAHLGHRDFASYKGCPGKLYPWDALGGHGKVAASGDSDMDRYSVPPVDTLLFVAAGSVLYTNSGFDASPDNVVVGPGGRNMPLLGVNATTRLVEHVDSSGKRTGDGYFYKRQPGDTLTPAQPPPAADCSVQDGKLAAIKEIVG